MNQKKITFVLGTRPEIIKLAPLIKLFKSDLTLETQVIFTNQHKELAYPLFSEFNLIPDIVLDVKRLRGDINELQTEIIKNISDIFLLQKTPDLLVVQGDTASSFSAALFAFQFLIPIAHVEAGLRSGKLKDPFPEEFYRQSISKMADFHFVPTEREKENLSREGIKSGVYVCGNTVIDSIEMTDESGGQGNYVLVSLHRRETEKLRKMFFQKILKIAQKRKKTIFKFLKHPANTRDLEEQLKEFENIEIIEPMPHFDFIKLMNKAKVVITDSGGVQEEAAYLKVPTLIVRNATEREDGLSDCVKLIGLDLKDLDREVDFLLNRVDKRENSVDRVGSESPSRLIYENLVKHLKGEKHESVSNRRAS
ncbi:MAG: UDP-N-acetylglucosamine 2-epimerase (non-hydrolyzing) [Halobacteriovoraceae bacterium]|nr:UDP-N-acetylglucosamine 2-epimerase (non-hydrolyzing) [Halobacteriovoraceae bacterium]MCB9095536.1 UDP-N-acetylglucosamine 2-epimerase (non-hydrolyzing) [Halobacteriovoraceae bacterium]